MNMTKNDNGQFPPNYIQIFHY